MSAPFEIVKEIYKSCIICFKDERGVHTETLVAGLSATCGELLLKECNVDLSQFPQGGFVLVDQVNDSGPRLLGYLEELLTQLKIDGGDWSAKIPAGHQPLRDPLVLASEFRPTTKELLIRFRLKRSQLAHAACMALALIIRDSRYVVPPAVSVSIASAVLMRAARSVPLGNE